MVAPVITLSGQRELFVPLGSTLKDPGATAQDDADGDLTAAIRRAGTVDTSVPGVYTLTYTVSDKAGNTASATRQVSVYENTATGSSPVYLTFDDGPSKTTPAVLDALNAAGVKATFFVVATGYNEKYLPLIADAAAAGHQIALHSASHDYSDIYQSADAYWQDIELLKERISPYVNTASLHYLRFPGGSTNTVSHRYGGRQIMQQLKAQAEQKGYAWIDWNVCAEDATASHPDAAQILRNIRRDADGQDTCVVLLHDTKATGQTVKALPDMIAYFREQGYNFCTVAQMDALQCETK